MKIRHIVSALTLIAICSAASAQQVKVFHNVPYAHAERYQSAVMVDGWDKTADYSQRGPQCPQTPTEPDMYRPGEQPQSEDCLNMSIYTPAMEGKLPVVVFLHGGSHHHGSSEWPLYDGTGLAEQGVVSVAISFRHGVFGFLYNEERQDSNLGYEDQITALRWIQKNIADFGGDPDNITLVGQSSGAQSVAQIIANLDEKLFKRAIIISAPYLLSQSSKKAKENAEEFTKILGKDPKDATPEELVAAEITFKKEVGGGSMAFSPSGLDQFNKHISCGVEDVLITYQKNDGAAYSMYATGKALEDYGNFIDNSIEKFITTLVFKNGANKLSRILKHQGVNTTEFKFTWCPPGANWKASHACDISILLGTQDDIIGYGLVGDLTPEEYNVVSTAYRKAVADFARTGVWECNYGKIVR